MQLINDALFLNTILFLFASSELVTIISPFTAMYASLKSHKSDFSIGFSNSDFFVNVVIFFLINHKFQFNLGKCLSSEVISSKSTIFGIPFLYNEFAFYAQNSLRSSIICCFFSGGM